MVRKIVPIAASAALAGGGLLLGGCGSSSSSGKPSAAAGSSTHTTTLPSGQTIVEAADRAAQASGYRLQATIDIHAASATVTMQMAGVIEQHGAIGALTIREQVGGHQLVLQDRYSHGIYFMTGGPGFAREAHGKRWVSFDLAEAERDAGLGGLESTATSNPAEFLGYLRAVGSGITRVGTATIAGDPTTEFRATLDLNRYASLVPASQRAAARTTIARLEADIGTSTLPVTVWVDAHHELRQMTMNLPTCVAGQRVSMSMTMALSDYSDVPTVTIPPASAAANITGLIESHLPSAQTHPASCSPSS